MNNKVESWLKEWTVLLTYKCRFSGCGILVPASRVPGVCRRIGSRKTPKFRFRSSPRINDIRGCDQSILFYVDPLGSSLGTYVQMKGQSKREISMGTVENFTELEFWLTRDAIHQGRAGNSCLICQVLRSAQHHVQGSIFFRKMFNKYFDFQEP